MGIEMCPIKHADKGCKSIIDYPIREFLNAGFPVTINTDNRTVSNTSLIKEFEFIQKNFRISDEEILLMTENAIDVAFADDDVKNRLFNIVNK
ncbi:MAG: hypothetical protein ACLT2Z_00415 [Eubacterium sp.]